jgi:cell division protein ZapE
MDAAWRALTDSDKGPPMDIAVQGRVLRVPQAVRGVARFSFEALCARPLGAADYLALASTFHTLLIDHIPKLDPAQRNEARRFCTLIDALYENRVKLVCSADAAPAALYPVGDGTFEFARTASRLAEMQSADYLAEGHGTWHAPVERETEPEF